MRVQIIAKSTSGMTGIGRYTAELCSALHNANVDTRVTFPRTVSLVRTLQRGCKHVGLDIVSFFGDYPLKADLDDADICHLSVQTFATLLISQRFPLPVVVTVHDIIPYLVRHSVELNTFRHAVDYYVYLMSLAGLRRADAIIAISQFTKQTLVDALSLPADRIHVVYPTVNQQLFRPVEVTDRHYAQCGLDPRWRYILFVGSDDPRKNLCTLVRALALLRKQMPDVKLLKVGAPAYLRERRRLTHLIADLGLQDDVVFVDHASDEELVLFYNLAQAFVMPSLLEGFGLPALEAMACGRPVVYANMGPLPEVVGECGVPVDPRDPSALAEALYRLLGDDGRRDALGRAGHERAALFSWQNASRDLTSAYGQTKMKNRTWASSRRYKPGW